MNEAAAPPFELRTAAVIAGSRADAAQAAELAGTAQHKPTGLNPLLPQQPDFNNLCKDYIAQQGHQEEGPIQCR